MLFWPGLIDSQIPAFRDAYHFYYPQVVWLDSCVERGEWFPRWNRFDGLGSSVPGQVSSALYYPLRALYLLPGLKLPQLYSLFIVVHLLIAAIGMRYAAANLCLRPSAGMLAACTYSLSCPILFQQFNLIYLCSASWIGFALASLIECIRHNNNCPKTSYRRSVTVFSLSTSMMLLAGDPQTAVHCWLVTAVLLFADFFRQAPSQQLLIRRVSWLGFASLLIVVLTSLQWIPAKRWSEHSQRVRQTYASSSATTKLTDPHQQVIANLSELQLSPMRRYEFSLSPWHLATLVWPTLGGHFQPHNYRLFALLGAEGRMWIPSIYIGVVPFLLVIWGCFNSVQHRWLLWLSLFALVAAFGFYSPVWLLRECMLAFGWNHAVTLLPPDQSLSVFGILTFLIPGYEGFRFPAKWTVWFAAGMSLYAACGFDRLLYAKPDSIVPLNKWLRRFIVITSIAFLGLGTALLVGPLGDAVLRGSQPDPWLGPLDPDAIAWSICFSSLLALVATLLAGRLVRRFPLGLLLFAIFELFVVGSVWCQFVPPPEISAEYCPREAIDPALESAFVWIDLSEANLSEFTSPESELMNRQKELQDMLLAGKLSSLCQVRNLAAAQSIEPEITEKLRLWLAWQDTLEAHQPALDAILAEFGVTHRLAFGEAELSDSAPPAQLKPAQLKFVDIPASKPLCEVFLDPAAPASVASTTHPPGSTAVQWNWIRNDCLKIQFKKELPRAAKLIVRQFNDGGWKADLVNSWVTAKTTNVEVTLNAPPSPFIEVDLPAGCRELTLERKWLW